MPKLRSIAGFTLLAALFIASSRTTAQALSGPIQTMIEAFVAVGQAAGAGEPGDYFT